MSQRWLFGSWLALVTACSSAPEAPPDAGTAATPDAGFVLDFPLTGDSVARGEQLYRGLRCANCHGVDGRGSPTFPGAPVLVGRTADDLQTALVDACENSTALGGCHPLKLPGVELSHLEDVAAFLLALAAASSDDPGPPCDRASGKICTFAGAGNAGNKKTLGITAREQSLFWPQDAQLDPQGRLVIMDWNNYLLRRVDACGDGDCPVLNIVGNATLGDDCSTPARRVLAPNTAMNHPVGASFFPNGDLVLWGWHMWKIKVFPIQPDGSYGEVLCMFGNGRGFGGTTFAEKIRVYDSTPPLLGNNAIDTLVATTFVGLDGVTPFSTTSADSGIYDFSWDPANRVLWVSDFSAQAIYGFAVPAPSAGMLLAGAGLLAARRRR